MASGSWPAAAFVHGGVRHKESLSNRAGNDLCIILAILMQQKVQKEGRKRIQRGSWQPDGGGESSTAVVTYIYRHNLRLCRAGLDLVEPGINLTSPPLRNRALQLGHILNRDGGRRGVHARLASEKHFLCVIVGGRT